jgi:hypothetical protein
MRVVSNRRRDASTATDLACYSVMRAILRAQDADDDLHAARSDIERVVRELVDRFGPGIITELDVPSHARYRRPSELPPGPGWTRVGDSAGTHDAASSGPLAAAMHTISRGSPRGRVVAAGRNAAACPDDLGVALGGRLFGAG